MRRCFSQIYDKLLSRSVMFEMQLEEFLDAGAVSLNSKHGSEESTIPLFRTNAIKIYSQLDKQD